MRFTEFAVIGTFLSEFQTSKVSFGNSVATERLFFLDDIAFVDCLTQRHGVAGMMAALRPINCQPFKAQASTRGHVPYCQAYAKSPVEPEAVRRSTSSLRVWACQSLVWLGEVFP